MRLGLHMDMSAVHFDFQSDHRKSMTAYTVTGFRRYSAQAFLNCQVSALFAGEVPESAADTVIALGASRLR